MDEDLPSISGGDLNGLWDEEIALGGRLVRRPIKLRRDQVGDDIAEVFHQIGGVPRFAQWANEFPYQFYTKILPRLLPQQSASLQANIGSLNITYQAAIPPSPLDKPPIDVESTDVSEPSS